MRGLGEFNTSSVYVWLFLGRSIRAVGNVLSVNMSDWGSSIYHDWSVDKETSSLAHVFAKSRGCRRVRVEGYISTMLTTRNGNTLVFQYE